MSTLFPRRTTFAVDGDDMKTSHNHNRSTDWPVWVPTWIYRMWRCGIYGHRPVPEHCSLPAHNFCAFCNKPMPWEGTT